MSHLKIQNRFLLLLGGTFVLASVLVVLIVNHAMRKEALLEAQTKARMLIDRNLASHLYFTRHLKPAVFETLGDRLDEEAFDPVWMSSTYAVREMQKILASLTPVDFYYKEAAIGARSPQNEADPVEKAFLRDLNEAPGLIDRAGVRTIDGKPYFYVMRRGEMIQEVCLTCHGDPLDAPGELVARYGPERSFHRKVGEAVQAISIRIPLETAYANANRLSLELVLMLLGILALLCFVHYGVLRRLVIRPLSLVREKAVEIAESERHLGEQIPLPAGQELADLTRVFNTMSRTLRNTLDHMDARVKERTEELHGANQVLRTEIAERTMAQRDLEEERQRLRAALGKVKQLSGMLPICANCKNIRDDKGYWMQIEAYIRDHSEAEFSHGLCPKCVRTLYPDVVEKIEKEGLLPPGNGGVR